MTNQQPKTSGPIIYGLTLSTPAHVVQWLAEKLIRYQRRIGTRWRAHDTTKQAILTIAWLEGGHTYRSLGAGNGVPKSTCRTLVQEGIKVLARRALPLTEVVYLARKAGWDYLIVDGVNIPTERIDAQFTSKQHWYSGKHKRMVARCRPWPPRTGNYCGCPRCCRARPSTSAPPAASASPRRS